MAAAGDGAAELPGGARESGGVMIGFAEPYEPGSPGERRMRELHHSVVPELVQQIVDEIDYYPEIIAAIRQQVAEEIAQAIESYPMGVTRRDCAHIAREVGNRP